MTHSYLLFRVADRLFGVKLQGAIEIVAWQRSRPVPLSYSYIEGIMEYRGTIYPVFHLAQLLGLGCVSAVGTAGNRSRNIRLLPCRTNGS